MFRFFAVRLLAILLLFLGVGAIAVGAYNAGVSAGAASVMTTTAGATRVVVAHGFGGFFPGFFFFPIGFLFFILLISALFRAAHWGGRGRGWYGGYQGHPGAGQWGGGMGGRFEDWHRQMHEQPSGQQGQQGQQPNVPSGQGGPDAPR